MAAANVPVTFTATDGGGNSSASSMNVDIVPYIVDLSRSAPFASRLMSNTMNPGADGYYPVYQGDSGHVVTGFNLYYSAGSATIGSTPLTVTAPSTTSLTVAIPNTLVTAVGNVNAYLKVTVNGIDSINNGTKYTSSSSTNANGIAFSSYLTEEGSFTNARKIYIDDQSPTISIAPFGTKYPDPLLYLIFQPTDDFVYYGRHETGFRPDSLFRQQLHEDRRRGKRNGPVHGYLDPGPEFGSFGYRHGLSA